MTVFAALSLMLIAAFLFALLEAARITELHKIAQINSESVTESLFAEYQRPLWESYRLLLMDAGCHEETISLADKEVRARGLSNDNLMPSKRSIGIGSEGTDLLSMQTIGVTFDRYLLITDGEGKVFVAAVSAYMKNNLPLESAKTMYEQYESMKSLEESGTMPENAVEEAVQAAETGRIDEETAARLDGIGEVGEISVENNRKIVENPLKSAVNMRKKGILNLVITNENALSDAEMNLSETVSHRKLETGNAEIAISPTWLDDVLLEQYLTTYFSSYVHQIGNRALAYELEYLLCGKESDIDNLRGTVEKLIGIREAANLLYLMTDAAKQSEALSVATMLAGATLNPAVIEVVKIGVLAAWAFIESILDVRALLQGDSIALLKNASEWTSDIYNLPAALSASGKAKSCSHGLDYMDYVGALLLFEKTSVLSYRAMDVQEAFVRQIEGYSDFRMDHMILEAEMTMTYQYHSIFPGMAVFTGWEYPPISCHTGYSYRKAGA